MQFEWRKDLKINMEKFTFGQIESGAFKDFVPVLDKLGFEPYKVVNYKCAYGSSKPSRKYIFGKEVKDEMHVINLCENIHCFQFSFKAEKDEYFSRVYPSPFYYFQSEFRDIVLENYPWCLNLKLAMLQEPKNSPKRVTPTQTSMPKVRALIQKLRSRRS